MLYEYLQTNYKPNEPIFVSDVELPVSEANLRKMFKTLSFHSRKPHPMKSGGDECVLFSFYIFSFWFFNSLLLDILF